VRTQHHDTCRVAGRTACHVIASGALSVVLALANSASAALIVDALGYDGHVSNAATIGVETHFTGTNFPPPAAGIALPATNPPLAPPLLASKDLTMTATSTSEMFQGTLYSTLIVQISAPTGNVFANALDNTLALPVEASLFLFSDTPGMKAVLDPANIGIENFNLPPFSSPVAGSYTVSGTGTQADPLHIQLGLAASQVATQNGFVKLHLRYGEMVYVPEPATCLLLLVGLAGLAQTAARRNRR
jgi:PEP-CTERM motif